MKNGNFEYHLNEGLTPEQVAIKDRYVESLTEGAFLRKTLAPGSINKNTTLNGFLTLVKEAIDRDQKN